MISQRARSFRVGRSVVIAREQAIGESEREKERQRGRKGDEGKVPFNTMLILFKPTRPVSHWSRCFFILPGRKERNRDFVLVSCLPFDEGEGSPLHAYASTRALCTPRDVNFDPGISRDHERSLKRGRGGGRKGGSFP